MQCYLYCVWRKRKICLGFFDCAIQQVELSMCDYNFRRHSPFAFPAEMNAVVLMRVLRLFAVRMQYSPKTEVSRICVVNMGPYLMPYLVSVVRLECCTKFDKLENTAKFNTNSKMGKI